MEYLARRRTCYTFVWIEYLNSYGATRLISLNVSTCIAAKRVSQPSNLYPIPSSNRLRDSRTNVYPKNPWKSVEIEIIEGVSQIPERKRKLANLPLRFRKSLSPAPCIIGLQSSKRDPAFNWLHYRKITNGRSVNPAPFSPRPRIPRGIVRSNRLDSLSTRYSFSFLRLESPYWNAPISLRRKSVTTTFFVFFIVNEIEIDAP